MSLIRISGSTLSEFCGFQHLCFCVTCPVHSLSRGLTCASVDVLWCSEDNTEQIANTPFESESTEQSPEFLWNIWQCEVLRVKEPVVALKGSAVHCKLDLSVRSISAVLGCARFMQQIDVVVQRPRSNSLQCTANFDETPFCDCTDQQWCCSIALPRSTCMRSE